MQSKQKQRGMTFFGLVVTAILIAMAGMVVIQAVPTYIEFKTIEKAVQKSAGGTTVAEVRTIFDKAATIDQISSITAKDLQITKDGGRVVVSFEYDRVIHLFGPANLVMKYKGESK
jgi:Tfp pilus assembly major pilin PilA